MRKNVDFMTLEDEKGLSNIDHFLLTRLNVRFNDGWSSKINDVALLRKRLQLFQDYCLPSVVRQSQEPTQWTIFFDSETPEEVRAQFNEIVSSHPFIKVVFCSGRFTADYAAQHVKNEASPGCKWVVTTRLDSDDAINVRYLETVRAAATIGKREYLNAASGLIVAGDRYYSKMDKSNAFLSASEALDGCKTVYIDQHTRLREYGPIRQVPLKYAWMQIVHGDNLSNGVRGIRVSRRTVDNGSYPASFVAGPPREPLGEMLADNSVGLVVRYSASMRRWVAARTKARLKPSN